MSQDVLVYWMSAPTDTILFQIGCPGVSSAQGLLALPWKRTALEMGTKQKPISCGAGGQPGKGKPRLSGHDDLKFQGFLGAGLTSAPAKGWVFWPISRLHPQSGKSGAKSAVPEPQTLWLCLFCSHTDPHQRVVPAQAFFDVTLHSFLRARSSVQVMQGLC